MLSPRNRALIVRLTLWLFGIGAQACPCREKRSLARLIHQAVSNDVVLDTGRVARRVRNAATRCRRDSVLVPHVLQVEWAQSEPYRHPSRNPMPHVAKNSDT